MMKYVFVMLGGFCGAIVRFGIGQLLPVTGSFPFATLSVNLLGCLFLGWFSTISANSNKLKPEHVLLIGTGFTGSFTTFSTFSVETIQLFENGYFITACSYVLLSVIAGLLLVFLGFKLALWSLHKQAH